MLVLSVLSPSSPHGKSDIPTRRQLRVAVEPGRLLHPAGDQPDTAEAQCAPLSFEEMCSVAEGLAASADAWSALSSGTECRWERIAETSRFEAWVAGWPPNGRVELHDYGMSAGALAVGFGYLVETSLHRFGAKAAIRSRVLSARSGQHVVASGLVHKIVNQGPGPAISVHVFSPRLASVSYFEIEGDLLRRQRTVELGSRAAERR
jgi:hypothetical protein